MNPYKSDKTYGGGRISSGVSEVSDPEILMVLPFMRLLPERPGSEFRRPLQLRPEYPPPVQSF